MTTPLRSARVLLLPARREGADPEAAPIRRYRLARLRLEERRVDPASRFEHLKRVFE